MDLLLNIKTFETVVSLVVRYDPMLLKTFNAHINVEICNSVKPIKYICKYVHEGLDEAKCVIDDPDNAIRHFRSGRYISKQEISSCEEVRA